MQIIKKLIILLCLVFTMTSCSYFFINKNVKKEDTKDIPKDILLSDEKSNNITFFQLDTIISIKLSEPVDQQILDNCEKIVADIHQKMSPELKGSELSKINQNAGKKSVKVSELTFEVIEKSLKYSEMSDGKFDISIRPLIKAWGIGSENETVPDDETLAKLSKKINYKNIILNKEEKTVFLKEEGCEIDLGGIAKGYSADLVANYLKSEGIESGILDFGGNIFALGKKTNGKPWKVGIKNPLDPKSKPFCAVSVVDKTVVTSGIYERYFEKDGKIYHHIMDVDNGKPINNGLISVTVIGNSSIDADAMSTTLFTLGLEEGLKKANKISEISAIFVNSNSEVYISENLKENFRLLNDNFKLMN